MRLRGTDILNNFCINTFGEVRVTNHDSSIIALRLSSPIALLLLHISGENSNSYPKRLNFPDWQLIINSISISEDHSLW